MLSWRFRLKFSVYFLVKILQLFRHVFVWNIDAVYILGKFTIQWGSVKICGC
uniref:Uncharacterized protein n=1 Tax=Anguilla anguilla TaxID=7936 RepID=A0A0E9PD54_ANGAN